MKNNSMMPEDLGALDARLNSEAQVAMRDVVRALPEDSVSMAWRSALNERLLAEAVTPKRRFAWLNFSWRPAVGLALAGALAGIIIFRPNSAAPATSAHGATASLEAELITTHTQYATFVDVAGLGALPMDTAYASRQGTDETPDWSELDLESL